MKLIDGLLRPFCSFTVQTDAIFHPFRITYD